jgi:hypothetical protein
MFLLWQAAQLLMKRVFPSSGLGAAVSEIEAVKASAITQQMRFSNISCVVVFLNQGENLVVPQASGRVSSAFCQRKGKNGFFTTKRTVKKSVNLDAL